MSMPPVSVKLTPCAANDVDKLSAVSAATFTETFVEYYSSEDFDAFLRKAYAPGTLAEEIANLGSTFYFVRVDGEIAGYMKINVGEAQSEDVMPDALEVERIYVLKRFKGRGLGRLMLERAFEEAGARGVESVWLGVWEHNNAALGFYKYLGFEVFGSHAFCVGKTQDTDLLMKRTVGPAGARPARRPGMGRADRSGGSASSAD